MISFSQKIWFYSVTAKHNTKPYRKERKSIMKKRLLALGIAAVLGANIAGTSAVWAADKVEITNVSYDPTRELYEQYNKVFAEHWKEQTGQEVGSDTVSRRLKANRHWKLQMVWRQTL